MPNPYPVLYRLGMTWWEGNDDSGPLPELVARRSPGVALDVGCGTGRHSVWLAQQGWTVVGVDGVETPLREARARADAAGVASQTTFVREDATRMVNLTAGPLYDLVLDIGCYHGLRPEEQKSFAAWVSRNTHEDAEVVIHAVVPRSGIGPKGIDEAGLATAFGLGWDVTSTPSTTTGGGPLRHAAFRWFTLSRRATHHEDASGTRP
jgi:SAM-dependent methyltransferase